MANPWHHAVSSARKWGGIPEDYVPVHEWFDATKAWCPDFRHRAIRHHSEGIFECMSVFGTTITLSTCSRCGKPASEHFADAEDARLIRKTHDDEPESWPKVCEFKEKLIPVRWIGEQHVQEDLGHIPTAADWLRRLTAEPWMNRSRRLSREQDSQDAEKGVTA